MTEKVRLIIFIFFYVFYFYHLLAVYYIHCFSVVSKLSHI
jgi:hypothetical protein